MALNTMYPAKSNSPETVLAAGISASDTSMTLADASVLPQAPNLCTIGDNESAEVVKYGSISGNVVSGLIRGQSGTVASVWGSGTIVARDFTSYDHDTFMDNINDLQMQIDGKTSEADEDDKAYTRLNGAWSTDVTAYGYCETAGSTAAKTVTIPGFSLVTGATIFVKFKYSNTSANPTLNVNDTGAISIYRYGNTKPGTTADSSWQADAMFMLTYDGAYWIQHYWYNADTVPSARCTTASGTAAKTASFTDYVTTNTYFQIIIQNSNTAQSALTLSINGQIALPIYINGAASSSSNYTLPAGVYIVYCDGYKYYFRTDGTIQGLALSAHEDFVITGTVSSGGYTLTDSRIDNEHWEVDWVYFATPANVMSAVTWTTDMTNHTVSLAATYAGSTNVIVNMHWVQ